MKNWLKKKLNKSYALYLYDFFLQSDDEVVGKVPQKTLNVSPDFLLQLYVVPLEDGDEYAKAVIKIEKKNIRVMIKYDSGRVKDDYDVMLAECRANIIMGWGTEHFYKMADDIIKKQTSLLEKFLYL